MDLMQFHLITLFPEMFQALDYGIVGRAQQKEILKLFFWNPRSYAQNKYRRVDDRPYGGGPGMVMQVQPLRAAIKAAKAFAGQKSEDAPRVIYLSPQGKLLNQKALQRFAQMKTLIIVAGRYEGIDERVIEYDIDEEWSLGNYVLSGGELGAMVMIDSITRLLPQVLGNAASAENDSFAQGLLDYPHYSRPLTVDGQTVPPVLLSGDHKAIARFRYQQALGKTWLKRPDLLKERSLNAQEVILLQEFIEKMRGNADETPYITDN